MSNELTYEQVSKRLKELQYAKAQMGQLSINDEIHKKALEMVLPILEQQERGDNDWIEWAGGECPVEKNTVVYAKFRDGDVDHGGAKAEGMDWFHTGACWDIIAYRISRSGPPIRTESSDMGEWIKCSERMPDVGQDVIVFNGIIHPGYYFTEHGDFSDANSDLFTIENATHWQPLPAPPEDV